MLDNTKSQVFSEVFKYIMAGVLGILIIAIGYKSISAVRERACLAEIKSFEIEMEGMDKNLRFGMKDKLTYNVPCNSNQVYIFDLTKPIDFGNFGKIPIMKDSLQTSGSHNVFAVRGNKVVASFYAGSLEISNPYYYCLLPIAGKISFFAEGAKDSARITIPEKQPQCA